MLQDVIERNWKICDLDLMKFKNMKKSELKSIIKEVILERKLVSNVDFVTTYITDAKTTLDEMEEEFEDLKLIHDASGKISTKLIKGLIDKYCSKISISSNKMIQQMKSVEKANL